MNEKCFSYLFQGIEEKEKMYEAIPSVNFNVERVHSKLPDNMNVWEKLPTSEDSLLSSCKNEMPVPKVLSPVLADRSSQLNNELQDAEGIFRKTDPGTISASFRNLVYCFYVDFFVDMLIFFFTFMINCRFALRDHLQISPLILSESK